SVGVMDLSEKEAPQNVPFHYSDSFFAEPSTSYNHELARMSLRLQISSWTTAEAANDGGKYFFTELDSTGRTRAAAYVHKLYGDIGFKPLRYYHYDVLLADESDKTAWSMAEKRLTLDGKSCVVLAVSIRGGNYGGEWVSNGNVGDTDGHAGFEAASREILREVEKQIGSYAENVTVKLWINGYSRSGSVANLVAGALDKDIAAGKSRVKKDDLFCYNFAVPLCTKDPDANSDAFSNIFNIINPVDIIMIAPFRGWGFKRYGVEKYLAFLEPGPDYDHLDAAYAGLFEGLADEKSSLHLVTWDHFVLLYLISEIFPTIMTSTAVLADGFQDWFQNTIRELFVSKTLSANFDAGNWQDAYVSVFGEDDLWGPVHRAVNALLLPVNLPGSLLGKGGKTLDPGLVCMIFCIAERMMSQLSKRPPSAESLLRSLPHSAAAIGRAAVAYIGSEGTEMPLMSKFLVAHTPESYLTLMDMPEEDAFGTGEIKGMNVAE
ncbi:MAG: hypothetical protein FWH26_11675, partial [Oscillospiraceae bacterium]|nr:hypothetical protein [Oscillospiraceae bacterium]